MTKKPTAIPQALDEQEQSLNLLHDRLTILENRCASILDPLPAPKDNGADPTPIMLVDRLLRNNRVVELAIGRLNSLFDRLQI